MVLGPAVADQAADDGRIVHVSLENPSDKLAFFVELAVVGADSGRLVAPIFWSDNYVSLLPGERRQIQARVPAHSLAGEAPVLRHRGVNVGRYESGAPKTASSP